MAIAIVPRTYPDVRLSDADGSTGSNARVVINPGCEDGELLIAIQSQTGGTDAAMTAPDADGFAWVKRGATGGSASVGFMKVWYRTASHEPSSWSFGGDGNGVVTVLVITNWDQRGEDFLWDNEPTFNTGTAASTHAAPSITIGAGPLLIINAWAAEEDGGTYSGYPGTWTEVEDTAATTHAQAVATENSAGAGTTGAINATYSGAGGSDYVALSICIMPPPDDATSAGSPSVMLPHWSTAGNTLVAVIAANSEGASAAADCQISSVIDDAHNTWVSTAAGDFVAGYPGEPNTAVRLQLWYCAGAAAITSVTATATQSVDSMALKLIEASGISNAATVVDIALGDDDADDVLVTAAGTNANANDLIIAAAATGNSNRSFTHSTPGSFTDLAEVEADSGAASEDDLLLRTAYRITSAGAAQSTTWTVDPASNGVWAMLALKEGAVVTTNANANWPALTHEIGFGVDPNDPTSVPAWVDVTDRVLAMAARRGRSYELARTQAGEADIQMDNSDGELDPGNTASGWYPDVRIFTPYRCRAVWNGLTYPVFTGYIERWPQTWENQFGNSPLVAVDGLATLSATRLVGTLGAEILADDPYAYWALDDGRLAQQAKNTSSTSTEPLSLAKSVPTGGSGFFGAELNLQGEESTCWEQTRTQTDTSDAPNSEFGVCLVGLLENSIALTTGVLMEVWARIPVPASGAAAQNYALMVLKSSTSSETQRRTVVLRMGSNSGALDVDIADSSDTLVTFPTSATGLNDGEWHHYVVHVVDAATNSAQAWVDGTEVLTAEPTTLCPDAIDRVCVGGMGDEWSNQNFTVGRFAHAAIFELDESDDRRVAVRANSGVTGFPEKSGARISRLLSYAGWTAGRAIDEGLSLLGSASTIAKQTLLQAVQDVAAWENGLAFVDAAGNFRFVDRSGRFNVSEKWVFGDGSGEIPYETNVEIDFDPKYIFNDVTVTRNAGRVTGGSGAAHKRDQASIAAYFTRNLDKTSGVASISQCLAETTWVLENYAQPRMRLANITITPSANPGLWPVALGVEIGDRITVVRRPFGGVTIELDCYIEEVSHKVSPNRWETTYSLSPALLTTYAGESGWILAASTLDTDTILG